MAKSNKSAQSPAAKPAKVAKVAKAAPAKKSAAQKPAKVAASQGQRAPRGQYAGLGIQNLVPKGEVKTRGDALIRFETIVGFKKVNDAIGAPYKTGAGEERQIVSADIDYLVKRELISCK